MSSLELRVNIGEIKFLTEPSNNDNKIIEFSNILFGVHQKEKDDTKLLEHKVDEEEKTDNRSLEYNVLEEEKDDTLEVVNENENEENKEHFAKNKIYDIEEFYEKKLACKEKQLLEYKQLFEKKLAIKEQQLWDYKQQFKKNADFYQKNLAYKEEQNQFEQKLLKNKILNMYRLVLGCLLLFLIMRIKNNIEI